MKKETIIYTVLSGLMMTSPIIASNDDPSNLSPNTKQAISRVEQQYSPFTAQIVTQQIIEERDAKRKEQTLKAEKDRIAREYEARIQAEADAHAQEMKELQAKIEELSGARGNH